MSANWIGQLAVKSLLYEVSTSPKPGLVDRHNAGAHDDMDYFTFMASGASIAGGFHKISEFGSETSHEPLDGLLRRIRPFGVEMEQQMFRATGGINTHKGMIFSLGLVTFIASRISQNRGQTQVEMQEVLENVSTLTQGICRHELQNHKGATTHGEKVYQRFGTLGIRGEVEAGFPTLQGTVLDELKRGCYDYVNMNDYFLQLLFMIMERCEDTTILHRHDLEVLSNVKLKASAFLKRGGMMQSDALCQVQEMDEEFIQKRISPGGSADLLAVSIMLGLLQGTIT